MNRLCRIRIMCQSNWCRTGQSHSYRGGIIMWCLYSFWDENVETDEKWIVNVIFRSTSLRLNNAFVFHFSRRCVAQGFVSVFTYCIFVSFLNCVFKESMSFLPSVLWVWSQNDSGFRSRTQTCFFSVISEHWLRGTWADSCVTYCQDLKFGCSFISVKD